MEKTNHPLTKPRSRGNNPVDTPIKSTGMCADWRFKRLLSGHICYYRFYIFMWWVLFWELVNFQPFSQINNFTKTTRIKPKTLYNFQKGNKNCILFNARLFSDVKSHLSEPKNGFHRRCDWSGEIVVWHIMTIEMDPFIHRLRREHLCTDWMAIVPCVKLNVGESLTTFKP